jgi:hypothetical protein
MYRQRVICILILGGVSLLSAQWGWEPDVRLTYDPGGSSTALNNARCIATGPGGLVHVVWGDSRGGGGGVYYKRSTDWGVNWGQDTFLVDTVAVSGYPSIAVFDSFVHVVYLDIRDDYDGEIYYKRSTNNGVNWSPDTRLTVDTSSSQYPSVAVQDSFVHVVWQDNRDGNWEIYYKRSTDYGLNWGADIHLSSVPGQKPSITATDSFVYVVWQRGTDIYYKRSIDFGLNWSIDTCLDTANYSENPSMSATGSMVYVVWDNGDEIYFKRSTDYGVNWFPDTVLYGVSYFYYPIVSASGPYLHVVWQHSGFGYGYDIFYKGSADNGVTWSGNIQFATEPGVSQWPSVASDSVIHVVWTDERDGNYEIYYKRHPNPNTIFESETTEHLSPHLLRAYMVPSGIRLEGNLVNIALLNFSIYDVVGRAVAAFAYQPVAKQFSFVWQPIQMTSGVYLVRVDGGGLCETKKVVLIKR